MELDHRDKVDKQALDHYSLARITGSGRSPGRHKRKKVVPGMNPLGTASGINNSRNPGQNPPGAGDRREYRCRGRDPVDRWRRLDSEPSGSRVRRRKMLVDGSIPYEGVLL